MIAVDLFAGAGGLSHGLKEAGFNVRCAVELDELAAETFGANHPGTTVIVSDVRKVSGADVLKHVPEGRVDLLAGCNPCQGFCSLTKDGDDDPRNELLLEMGRLVEELKPQAVLMENVPGLLVRGRKIFDAFLELLHRNDYQTNYEIVQMADHGVPQYRRRLVLVAGLGRKLNLPMATHARVPGARKFIRQWVTVRQAIGKNRPALTLSVANKNGGPLRHNWHVVRDLQPQTKARLKQAIPGKTWKQIDEKVRPKCHQGEYEGFTNTYGRMHWDAISPTITGGCTTVAKGRFGHPDRRRYTVSVRESATLQSFPKSYRFTAKHIDRVCGQIGNAVPPLYAHRVGQALISQLKLAQSSSVAKRPTKKARKTKR